MYWHIHHATQTVYLQHDTSADVTNSDGHLAGPSQNCLWD